MHFGLWPSPRSCHAGGSLNVILRASSFKVDLKGNNDPILQRAASRMTARLKLPAAMHRTMGPIEPHLPRRALPPPPTTKTPASEVNVLVVSIARQRKVDESKSISSDESFRLSVTRSGATIEATEAWGAIYGMETFLQLVSLDGSDNDIRTIVGTPVAIADSPRFPWRGLMVDSANHFISLSLLRQTIDTMVANKMNLLHWHIVDSYSFPFVSTSFPQLSIRGAWSADAVYTHSDIKHIVQYAHDRGIRVVGELDTPGHAYSLGLAYPNVTVSCPEKLNTDIGPINVVPIDPTSSQALHIVKILLNEFESLFLDTFLHVGGTTIRLFLWFTGKWWAFV